MMMESTQTMMTGKMKILIVKMKIVRRSDVYRLRVATMFRSFKEQKE